MRRLKKIFKSIAVLLLVLIALLYIFDYEYILRGVRIVYFTGHKTAFIDDTPYFDTHTIEKGKVQEWETHPNYNKVVPTQKLTKINEELGTAAFLIIKDNKVWYENYEEGYTAESATNSFSMAKSITTALLFKAISDGYIENINTLVHKFIPEIKGVYASKLTVGDLSSMSSGLNWIEHYTSPFSITARANYDDDLRKVILGLEVVEEPGKSSKYLSGATQLLGMVIEKATKKNLSNYLSESFWKPMGMSQNGLWQLDSEENEMEKSYCCIASNARDFAKFGRLWIQNGNWNGVQLIPEKLAILAQESRFSDSPHYGYGLWLENYKEKKISYMRGILGQYVISIPEDNIIIVRLGHKRLKPKRGSVHSEDFYEYIDETYKMLKSSL